MGARPQNLMLLLPVALLVAALLPSVALAGAMEGTVSTTHAAGGKVESSSFTYWNGKETVEVKVFLDKTGQKMAQEANGREALVSGSMFTKKKERWFKVKSYFITMYTAVVRVTKFHATTKVKDLIHMNVGNQDILYEKPTTWKRFRWVDP